MNILLKTLVTIAILLGGPLLGILIAILYAGFASDGGGSPGDGFLGILCIFGSLIISVPTSIFFAVFFLLRKPKVQTQTST
jgi:hypothetical protein